MHFPDNQLDLHCGPGTFGPNREYRCLDSIWPSLRDPSCTGPDPVYAIAMDVGRTEDLSELKERMLLFGIVICAIRKVRRRTREQPGPCFTPLPRIVDDPGRCVAIEAGPGERVVVPPDWAHYVVNADIQTHNSFSEHVVTANMDSTTSKCVRPRTHLAPGIQRRWRN